MKIRRFLSVLLPAVLLLGLFAAYGSVPASASAEAPASEETAAVTAADYDEYLFDDSYVHRIDITADPEAWDTLQATAVNKPKLAVTVTIDGETYENVRMSPKGSSSLRNTANSTYYNDRYSYKLSFGALTEGQTYHGLDTLSLNSSFEDPSCTRDWLAYRLFAIAGVPAPLVSFTELYVNGELRGLYYAVENEGRSFLQRNDMLPSMTYVPEPYVLSHRNAQQAADVSESTQRSSERHIMTSPISAEDTLDTPGADLKYTGDDLSLYADIFDNTSIAITGEDEDRVITALKAVSEGRPEDGVDTDEVIRYFAVHNFVTSWDSYTGVMLHNYLLAEHDGFLSMIPWDYNLAFLTTIPMHTGDAITGDDIISLDIDDPCLQDVSAEDRPMWSWITQDDSYLAQYHAVLTETILPYFESGEFESDMDALREMIRPYLEQDPTYSYGMDEFDENFAGLTDFCLARAAAVREQLG